MAGDELAPFVLKDAEVEGLKEGAEMEEKQAGTGAYGYVFKVRVGGVERIAKKLHSAYVNQQVSVAEKQGITSKFREECINLSKLRHPNVVQFIGVHYGRRGRTDLTLIMECVHSDMNQFINTNPHIPLPLKLSILRDISFGLVYLHEYNPPIVHRDLHAKNILISDRCQAKIADVGVAKVVDIHAQLAASHTQAPGHVLYMPPEALKEKASCTPKLDIFSFGHLSLYTVNQEFPKVYNITLTMAIHEQGIIERLKRRAALDAVGIGHCLYPIITDCLFDNPDQRPTTRELNNRLCLLVTQNPEAGCSKSKCKDDLEQLRKRVSQLEAENTELASISKRTGNCDNPKCEETVSRFKERVTYLERSVAQIPELKKQIELSKNEAVGDIASAKKEADLYRVDFVEERKDRERAMRELESLRRERFKEVKEECNKLKMEHARNEAKLRHEVETSNAAIDQLKAQIERLCENEEAQSSPKVPQDRNRRQSDSQGTQYRDQRMGPPPVQSQVSVPLRAGWPFQPPPPAVRQSSYPSHYPHRPDVEYQPYPAQDNARDQQYPRLPPPRPPPREERIPPRARPRQYGNEPDYINVPLRQSPRPSPQYRPPPQQHPVGMPLRLLPAGRFYEPPAPKNVQPQRNQPLNPSVPQEENILIQDIDADADISEAAADVRREVFSSISSVDGTLSTDPDDPMSLPLDSNLVCPMCKRQFRIGQIQHYRSHVNSCQGR